MQFHQFFFVLVQVQLLEHFPFLVVELDPSIWIMWHVGERSPDLLTVPVLDSIITTVATRKMLASLAKVSKHIVACIYTIRSYRGVPMRISVNPSSEEKFLLNCSKLP